MPKGRFSATGDVDLNGHHLLDWRYLADIPRGGAASGQALVWNGTQWAPSTVSAGSMDAPVTSVFGRIGDVVGESQDYRDVSDWEVESIRIGSKVTDFGGSPYAVMIWGDVALDPYYLRLEKSPIAAPPWLVFNGTLAANDDLVLNARKENNYGHVFFDNSGTAWIRYDASNVRIEASHTLYAPVLKALPTSGTTLTVDDYTLFTTNVTINGNLDVLGTLPIQAGSNITFTASYTISTTGVLTGLIGGTNITTNGSTISVVDAPTFAGTVTSNDWFKVTETAFAKKSNYYSRFQINNVAGVDTFAHKGFDSNIKYTAGAGSLALGAVRCFDASITFVDSTPTFFGEAAMLFRGTVDADALTLGSTEGVFHIENTNPSSAQSWANGFFSVNCRGTTGDVMAAYTRANVTGSAAGYGYRGYAKGASGATGLLVGVQGYALDTAGANHSAIVGVDGLISSSGGTSRAKEMGLRSNGHVLVRGASAFIANNAGTLTPSALSPTHVQAVTNSGELYVQGAAEFDAEVYLDANESHSLTSITASYTAAGKTFILADATSGTVTVTLPAVSGKTGRTYTIKKTDSSLNTVIVDGNGAETIDGAATYELPTQYLAVKLISNGSAWYVV